MFRDMRRKKQELTQEETKEILLKGTSGGPSWAATDIHMRFH